MSQLRTGRDNLIIFDPTSESEMNEVPFWRPSEPNVIQIEMEDPYQYAMYQAPDSMREFADADLLRGELRKIVRLHLIKLFLKAKSLPDIEFETDRLVDLGMVMMSNYRIANIYLDTQLVEKIIPDRGQSRRDVLV